MDTVPGRLAALLAFVPDVSVRAFEKAAGLQRGAAQKILDGKSEDPRGSTLVACARALGTTSDYLAAGVGEAPSERRVRRVLRAALEAVCGGGAHAPRLATARRARKLTPRSAARA